MAIAFLRTKRFWKRVGIGAAILLGIVLIANGVMGWWVERQMQARIDRIRAAGDPASIAELKPASVPDDRNAAVILEKIAPRLQELRKADAAFLETPLGKQYEAADDSPPTAEQAAAIKSMLAEFADVDAALAAAAKCDEYAPRLDYSTDSAQLINELIELQQPIRAAARFIDLQMEVDIATGQRDESMERGIQLLRFARMHEKLPSLISYLVSIAVHGVAIQELSDTLSGGPVSDALHEKLDAELALDEDPQRLVRALKSEGALASGWNRWPMFETDDKPYSQVWNVFGWPLKWYLLGVFDYADELRTLADRPWYEVRDQFGTSDSTPIVTGHGKLADLLVPAARASFQANARGIALSRSLRIYNALRQFAEKNGREATGLADLHLPAAATIDPYSGQPLKLKHTGEGWIVYSVMENGIDDGGNFKNLKDYGVAPWKLRSGEQ